MPDSNLRVAAYMRADLARSLAVGPFLVTLNPHTPSLGHNYAMPLPGATPSADEVDALVDLFKSRERTPRLEFVSSSAPEAEAALLAAGFGVDQRLPTLVMPDLDRLVRAPAPDGIVIEAVTTDRDLLDAVAVQNEAYGEPPTSQAYELERMRSFVGRGGVVALARDASAGQACGAGIATPPLEAVSEIAAVATDAAYRRRGIAAAIGSRLTELAFGNGAELVFLDVAHPDEERIYVRLGYQRGAERVWMSRR